MIKAIGDNLLCTDGDFGDQVTETGILIKSIDKKSQGITSRWFKIFERGPDVDSVFEIGKWVLVAYGRWTEGMELEDDRFEDGVAKVWKVEPESCLAIADEKPDTFYYNSNVATAEYKTR